LMSLTWDTRHEFFTEQTAYEALFAECLIEAAIAPRWYRQLWARCKGKHEFIGRQDAQRIFRCDFVFPRGKRIVEVDGHPPNPEKDLCLSVCHGYEVWHIRNQDLELLSQGIEAVTRLFLSYHHGTIPPKPFFRLDQMDEKFVDTVQFRVATEEYVNDRIGRLKRAAPCEQERILDRVIAARKLREELRQARRKGGS
jgi:hypothetical protein